MDRRTRHYPVELRERAVHRVAELAAHHRSQWAAIEAVASELDIGTAETVRKWVRRAEVDDGRRDGLTSGESSEIRRLRRENAELRRSNAILAAASDFFSVGLDRPASSS